MRTKSSRASRPLAADGEFLWEYVPGNNWLPVGEDRTLGLAAKPLADMRALATCALERDARMRSAPRLAQLIGHRRWACAFRLTPPAEVELVPWAERLAELFAIEIDDDGAQQSVVMTVTLAQAGGQRLALKTAWELLSRMDGLGLSSAHCLILSAR